MRGPWHIQVSQRSSDCWQAQVVDDQLGEQVCAEAEDAQDAIHECRDLWSVALHEDFGPADFVVHYPEDAEAS